MAITITRTCGTCLYFIKNIVLTQACKKGKCARYSWKGCIEFKSKLNGTGCP